MNGVFYFAYGSNMNPERVKARGIKYVEVLSGHLFGYELVFNKYSSKREGSAANIARRKNEVTEGVLYLLSDAEQITKMDPFEGFPNHYARKMLSVVTNSKSVKAWVYIANQSFVKENLLPPRWYLNHLLGGREFLSEQYYKKLLDVRCLENSEIEISS